MLFVERDEHGAIVAIRQGTAGADREPVSFLDDEVLSFLKESGELDALSQMLALSDNSLIRVLEDLVDLLISKKIILFTDLPQEAQEKIRERKRIRQHLSKDDLMVADIL
ncbi:hypothetical protein [Desulfogranum mediterraneum]|uniref:hypothetical protein n=1 Tax=Desulfogranum mediterraneum TaxID=160661 RepID=UPI000427A7E7|nr:hypothetical protein [Desulfogranum mediterraneum]